jgi:hypothetical protein
MARMVELHPWRDEIDERLIDNFVGWPHSAWRRRWKVADVGEPVPLVIDRAEPFPAAIIQDVNLG